MFWANHSVFVDVTDLGEMMFTTEERKRGYLQVTGHDVSQQMYANDEV